MTLMSLSIKWIRLAFIACELLCLKFCVTGSHVCSTNSNLLTVEKLSAPDLILRKSGREGIIIECNAPIENLLIPVESCYVPSDHRSTGVVSVSSHPHAFPSSLYLMLQIATLWNANPASSQQSELIFDFQTVNPSTRSKDRYVVDISHSVQKTYTNRIDTFHIPVYPQWKIRSGGVYVRKFSSNAVYLFYAAVHMVPPIHDVERNRSPNLLDPYFLALGQPGASEDPKSVLQDLLDPDTLDSGSVELITDAAGKRHFQFGTHGTNTTTRMSVNNLKSLVTPNSRDANVLNVNLDAVAFFPEIDEHVHLDFSVCISLHATVTTAAQFCLHLAQIHFSTHARLTQRIFNGTVDSAFNQYPVALRAPWTDTTKALERIVVTFKYSGPDNIRIILRPLSIYVVQDQEQISDISRDHRTFPVANQEPAMGLTWSTVNDSITKYPKAHHHALGAPSISDTTPGRVSPAGGSTVPAPDPHDTRDPTVSSVQPHSRGMGSLRAVVGALRAVVGALGAGRRSTSVVAAAVVRRGMPRPGRAGAWGTGRAALLVLGVVCGVALLLAAVVLVFVRSSTRASRGIPRRAQNALSLDTSGYSLPLYCMYKCDGSADFDGQDDLWISNSCPDEYVEISLKCAG